MRTIKILLGVAVAAVSISSTLHAIALPATKSISAEIRSIIPDLSSVMQIEMQLYDEARIMYAYLEHQRKKKKTGEVDYLYVKGAVKNLRNRILSGAVVIVDFMDNAGNVVAREQGSVIPRIIRLNGAKKGHFTVKTKYDPFITQCKIRLDWSGKEDD